MIGKVHLFPKLTANKGDFFVLPTIISLDALYYNFAYSLHHIQDTNSHQDGKSPTIVGQSSVLVWARYDPHDSRVHQMCTIGDLVDKILNLLICHFGVMFTTSNDS